MYYTLDIETVKRVMQEHRETARLSADVPAGVIGRRHDAFHIEITFQAGALYACTLQGSSGWSKTAKDALHELERLGAVRLRWTVMPLPDGLASPLTATASTLVAGTPASCPRRTEQEVNPEQMRTWPRVYRGVFSLSDGCRTVVKLAEILATDPLLVAQAIQKLQKAGLLSGPPNGESHQEADRAFRTINSK